MKKLLYPVIAVAIGITVLASCKSGSMGSADAKKDSVTMPYKATFSSSFVPSDSAKYVQSVLQSLKDWEDNKLANGKAYYADTVVFYHWSGLKLNNKRDSVLKLFQKFRDSLSGVKIEVGAWLNSHSTDKNEDWVNVWYKETDTYKTGRIDSAFYEDANQIVKGKIVFTMDQRRNLPKGK
jgi:hypothetical protein